MSDTKVLRYVIIALIAFVVIVNSFFVVEQTEQAIVLEFGKPVEFTQNGKEVSFINTPGLKFKIPFIQDVVYFDNRILNFEAADKEILDLEKKTLTVNAFAKYRITNPLTFYRKVTDQRGINERMDRIFEASLRDAIGSVPLSKLLTEERKVIMQKIKDAIREKSDDFGVNVFDVRIVRADLPKENSEAIYNRMKAEREKEAREFRAEGEEEAQKLRSKADREARVIVAEAKKEAEIIKGHGDSEAIKIFGQAFNRDPEFYKFYRSMQAYKESISKEDTKIIISPETDFLGYFGDVKGNGR